MLPFSNLLKTPKKLFLFSVCIVSIISLLILLITIKSSNRKFNPNLISSANTLFVNHLEKLNSFSKEEAALPLGMI